MNSLCYVDDAVCNQFVICLWLSTISVSSTLLGRGKVIFLPRSFLHFLCCLH